MRRAGRLVPQNGETKKFPRRQFLHLAAGAGALPRRVTCRVISREAAERHAPSIIGLIGHNTNLHHGRYQARRHIEGRHDRRIKRMRIIGSRDQQWKGQELFLGRKRIASVIPDGRYPGMWRVQRSDGSLTDMVNLTSAKEAAMVLALASLNGMQEAA
jgi:hypothetical protein